jgi:hypothetical protein
LCTAPAEGSVASGGADVVIIAALVGASSFHRTSMMVTAMPAVRNRTMPVANVVGEPDNTNRPNTRNDTGMIAVRSNGVDMLLILASLLWRADNEKNGAREAGWLDPASLR